VEGFEAFFNDNYDSLLRTLTLACGDRAAAEEACQEAFARAFRRWRVVSAADRPATWVYVVAVRCLPRRLTGDASETDEPDLAGFEDQVVEAVWVEQLLAGLAPRQRAAVVLRFLGGLSLAEVAEALGCKVGTVKATLHVALGRLRTTIPEEVCGGG
jgi:RNA polymerase sigma factor (sigma-70 family)